MNIETQEPTWDVPPGGYTRKDGMLVLATGKVIEDPLTTMTDEERRAKELETKCSECESRDATRAALLCSHERRKRHVKKGARRLSEETSRPPAPPAGVRGDHNRG